MKSFLLEVPSTLSIVNVFCPTGEGGGVDATCSLKGKSGKTSGVSEAHNDVVRLGTKAGNNVEHAILLTRTGERIAERLGTEGSADVPDHPSTNKAGAGLIVVHNHPDNSKLSPQDLKLFAKYAGVDEIHAVTHDGTVHTVRPLVDRDKLYRAVNEFEAKVKDKILDESLNHTVLTEDIKRGLRDKRDRMLGTVTEEMVKLGYVESQSLPKNQFNILNVFCPTGVGGGVDATCSPGGKSSSSSLSKTQIEDAYIVSAVRQKQERGPDKNIPSTLSTQQRLDAVEWIKQSGDHLAFTHYTFEMRRELKEKGIDIDQLSDTQLAKEIRTHFTPQEGQKKYPVILTESYSRIFHEAPTQDKLKILEASVAKLVEHDKDKMLGSYYDISPNNHFTKDPNEETMSPTHQIHYSDALENAAKSRQMEVVEGEGGKLRYASSKLDSARRDYWKASGNYSVFKAGFAEFWAITGGTDAQKLAASVCTDHPENKGKSFYTGYMSEEPAPEFKARVAPHFETMKKETQEFYKKKLDKELVVYRGVGGTAETYLPSPVESWSKEVNTAKRFAKMNTVNNKGSILTTTIRYKDLLFSWETMKTEPGWPPEKELQGKKEFVPFGGALTTITKEQL